MSALRALRTLRDKRHGRLPLYEEITPSASWTDGVNGSNLIIDIPGFKNEEVNMEIDESGNVSIKGRHDVGSNRFRRFSMTVKAPEKTDMKRVVGSIEGGLYTVVFPKMEVSETMLEGTVKEAALDTEPSSAMEKAVTETESLTEAAVGKTETDERVPTEAVSDMETNVAEAEKETKTQDEIAATNESEMATKPIETCADQRPQNMSEPPETFGKEAETVTKQTETALALPETDEPPEPNRASTVKNNMVKFAIKNEEQEHQEIKKDGGFLENVMEMITEHKACIVSAILAFSLGILISRRIRS